MKEIEILVKVLESKKSALNKLSKFRIHHISKIRDSYYYHPSYKTMLPSKRRNATEMLRIRAKDNKNYITYKNDVFSGKDWLYSDEYETEIMDAKILKDILNKLMFRPLVDVINERTIYYYKNFEICLEDVKTLGVFLEIECIKPKGTPQKVRKEIFDLIIDIGINVSDEVQAGKAELLFKKINGI